MATPPDELEEKVDLLLENITAKERAQQLEEENLKLRKRLEQLELFVQGNGPVEDYKDLQEKFSCFQNSWEEKKTNHNHLSSEEYVTSTQVIADILLTPQEIDDFLHVSKKFQGTVYYQTQIGVFMTRLIQNSYDAGNNDFILTPTGN